jgi:hypothetical protein
MKKAIQFVGTQRSGTNLLRVMLNQHPEISAPHPPHILQILMPMMKMYGDLSPSTQLGMTSGFEKLVDDVCTLVEKNPVSWSIEFDRKSIAAKCENRSLPQVMKAIYEAKAETKNATWWCCKSMASIHYANEIEAAGIHPIYLFMYRDGRDVACSFRKAVVGEKHIYNLAKQWSTEQELSLELAHRLGKNRVISICYEEFISDTERTLRRICNALKVEYIPAMLEYADADESKITASSGQMWSNLTQPLMRNNSKKYLTELSQEDLVMFESVAGDTLDKLGYKREVSRLKLRTFFGSQIADFQILNTKLQAEAKERSAEDMTKRREQDQFIAKLKSQFSEYEKSNVAHA